MQNFQALKERFSHLELSILPLSSVLKDNETKRLDSEYFKKEYLENEERFNSQLKIKDLIQAKIQNIRSLNLNKNFNYLQISDVDTSNGLEFSTMPIDFKDIPDRATYILHKGDICISTVRPNRNSVALINNPKRLIGTSGFCVLRVENKDKIKPEVLYIFCKTKFFITKMMRANTASLYPAVVDNDILHCQIPIFPDNFQKDIEILVKDAHQKLEQSKSLYKEAEVLLYSELGLNALLQAKSAFYHMKHCEISKKYSVDLVDSSVDYRLPQNDKNMNNLRLGKKYPHLNFSILPLSHSLQKIGRLDSEYYQNKYEDIEKVIKKHLHERLGDLVSIKKSIEPGSEAYKSEGIEFVRVSNLSKFGISKSDIYLSREQFSKDLAKLAPQKDTILLSKDGSVGISYCVEEDLNCITSGAILHLKIKDKKRILPQVLSLILNSITTQLQAERDCGGSIISHWKISEIENLLIPILDLNTQTQIANKLKTSFLLKKEAITLLNEAKSKVERAIANKSI